MRAEPLQARSLQPPAFAQDGHKARRPAVAPARDPLQRPLVGIMRVIVVNKPGPNPIGDPKPVTLGDHPSPGQSTSARQIRAFASIRVAGLWGLGLGRAASGCQGWGMIAAAAETRKKSSLAAASDPEAAV
jgi:hypothetical protein